MSETEAKFLPESEAVLEQLAALPALGLLWVTHTSVVEQVDTYYDTPERAVAAASASLRVREIDVQRWFTAKVGQVAPGRHEREEVEEPATGELSTWLRALQQAGRLHLAIDPDALAPVLEIRNRRTLLHLRGPGETIVELALDRVRYHGPRGESAELEVELELKHGPPEPFQEAVRCLEAQFSLAPAQAGKYQRALAAVG